MRTSNPDRIVILGPPGSGKTTLAEKIVRSDFVSSLDNPPTHLNLDHLRYEDPQHFLSKRNATEVEKDVREYLASNDTWVIEGTYNRRFIDPVISAASEIILFQPLDLEELIRNVIRKRINCHPDAQELDPRDKSRLCYEVQMRLSKGEYKLDSEMLTSAAKAAREVLGYKASNKNLGLIQKIEDLSEHRPIIITSYEEADTYLAKNYSFPCKSNSKKTKKTK